MGFVDEVVKQGHDASPPDGLHADALLKKQGNGRNSVIAQADALIMGIHGAIARIDHEIAAHPGNSKLASLESGFEKLLLSAMALENAASNPNAAQSLAALRNEMATLLATFQKDELEEEKVAGSKLETVKSDMRRKDDAEIQTALGSDALVSQSNARLVIIDQQALQNDQARVELTVIKRGSEDFQTAISIAKIESDGGSMQDALRLAKIRMAQEAATEEDRIRPNMTDVQLEQHQLLMTHAIEARGARIEKAATKILAGMESSPQVEAAVLREVFQEFVAKSATTFLERYADNSQPVQAATASGTALESFATGLRGDMKRINDTLQTLDETRKPEERSQIHRTLAEHGKSMQANSFNGLNSVEANARELSSLRHKEQARRDAIVSLLMGESDDVRKLAESAEDKKLLRKHAAQFRLENFGDPNLWVNKTAQNNLGHSISNAYLA